jgi:hypothetical protein
MANDNAVAVTRPKSSTFEMDKGASMGGLEPMKAKLLEET